MKKKEEEKIEVEPRKFLVNPALTERIDKAILEERDKREKREPSGRLSAGKLGWALQHQMLHHFKVPGDEVDEFTLRKFQRGNDVEDRIVEWVKPDETQKELWYRDVIGYADMVGVNGDGLPYEIKSTTNMAFKYKMKGGPSLGHRLQGMCYAQALGVKKFYIVYVASDDYRTLTFEEEVTDEVDKIIDEYEAQVKKGVVPEFVAKEKWQGMKQYNSYPEFMKLSEEEIATKLKEMGLAK